ncbi:chromosome segregation protein SMC [Pseudomonas sp. C27(2019)]|uniref:chromosome segregation protein SMC n=1 Tax=Pseudomonas sp. C27(2019) TaxID=2604941 RepID=UPI0012466619|nr:chromosome segregation protein SMC [Pseudomonas sp. C27(2019)]QEY58268.1 chromosome segregation protein SMC [Pseudomonas sp. C27(2019)]
MRLKCIRLAGFKSFVDPTTASFPSNMTAVVGPNGCGKSNIIDAVRWVLGESSAKNLRGESMTDVIFNGSNTRKPVSQASIELVFDNSDGTLQGEYGSYAEISIRRRVTREAQSTYYLNGVKCRRRDITDIFLGTGLGPRSYAIIEQGMISRLVEARPDDLRIFIEEAAGISKYKERRRETENRIRRTQENLERLLDLREELGRQIERLQRQANAAEKYQEYKAEQHRLNAELTALRWQQLNSQAGVHETQIAELETALEACIAEQRQADAKIELLRDGHHELSDTFNKVQGRFYAIGADIARHEQSIQHAQQRLRQLHDDLKEAERARVEMEGHLASDRELLSSLDDELLILTEQQAEAQLNEECSAAAFVQAEEAMHDWQERWNSVTAQSAQPRSEAGVQRTRIDQLEHNNQRLVSRQQRLHDEQQSLDADPMAETVDELQDRVDEAQAQLDELSATQQLQTEQLQDSQEQLTQKNQQQQQVQGQLQRLHGRISALEALQQAALNPDQGVQEWLEHQQLQQQPRLLEGLKVAAGWELAVETVLAADLQAVQIESWADLELSSLSSGHLRLVSHGAAVTPVKDSLLSKVLTASLDVSPWLASVYAVESLDEALQLRPQLNGGESVVSKDGYWLAAHFLTVQRGDQQSSGVLARAQELDELLLSVAQLDEQQQALDEQLQELHSARHLVQEQSEQLRRDEQGAHRVLSELKSQLSGKIARIEQLQLRRTALAAELADVSEQQQIEVEQIAEARLLLQDALETMANAEQQQQQLQAEQGQLRSQFEQRRQQAQQDKNTQHQLALRISTLSTQKRSTEQALQRLEQQFAQADQRREQLNLNLEEGESPIDELRAQLEAFLQVRLATDDELRAARTALEDADTHMRAADKQRSQAEQRAHAVREQLEQQRLALQTLTVQKDTLNQQLQALQMNVHQLLEQLPAEAEISQWQQQLTAVATRIERLGAINLAAIEEYRQQSERKTYLDAQNDDLVEALDTLENVIRKIDRETRNRFKETFDLINNGLQELFPKVFGGGHASLEMTGDDLLSTGVAIMARPPGKKNSTIHLLSGGEKALTALALVFAIFQLNPAPFCMLDEVDAPLDDANVGRYARLVKEMSEKVQFIYITHNKIAMEMADQLLGVTMHEPGCSRLVAVNVEEAAALAES